MPVDNVALVTGVKVKDHGVYVGDLPTAFGPVAVFREDKELPEGEAQGPLSLFDKSDVLLHGNVIPTDAEANDQAEDSAEQSPPVSPPPPATGTVSTQEVS